MSAHDPLTCRCGRFRSFVEVAAYREDGAVLRVDGAPTRTVVCSGCGLVWQFRNAAAGTSPAGWSERGSAEAFDRAGAPST